MRTGEERRLFSSFEGIPLTSHRRGMIIGVEGGPATSDGRGLVAGRPDTVEGGGLNISEERGLDTG